MNKRKMKGTLLIAVFIISTLAIAIPLASAVEPSYPPPDIDGVIGEGEWDGALEIGYSSSMGTVNVLATTDYLYMLFELVDSTDAREGENTIGNDKISANINPTAGTPWCMPCDIIFQMGTDPASWSAPSCGPIDGYETDWKIDGVQYSLPADLETKTIYDYGLGIRTTELRIPLDTIDLSLGDTLTFGGTGDNLHHHGELQDNCYQIPDGLDWSDIATYAEYQYNVLNERTGFYYHTMELAIEGSLTTDQLTGSVTGTVPMSNEGTVTVDGTGTLTTYEYTENPGTGFSSSTNDYFDIKIDDPAGITSIRIEVPYTLPLPTELVESELILHWYDGTKWSPCSNTGVDTVTNLIWAIITDDTIPSLSQLTGTPFGIGGSLDFDSDFYKTGETASITLGSTDENTDSETREMVGVWVKSDTDVLGATIALFETGVDTAIFTGTFDLVGDTPGTGEILVMSGDTIYVTYHHPTLGDIVDTAEIDDTAPVVEITAPTTTPPAILYKAGVVTITATIDEENPVDVVFQANGVPIKEIIGATDSETITWNTLYEVAEVPQWPDGIYTITVTATDGAGNFDSASVTLTVDNTGPTVTDATASPSIIGLDVSTKMVLTATVMDDGIGVLDVEIDCSDIGGASDVPMTDVDEDGVFTSNILTLSCAVEDVYELTITATDKLDNINDLDFITVEVIEDENAPYEVGFTEAVSISGGLIVRGLYMKDLLTGPGSYKILVGDADFTEITETELISETWMSTTDYDAFGRSVVLNLEDYTGDTVTITMVASDLVGTEADPIILYAGKVPKGKWCPVELYKGWNLVSLPLIPDSSARGDILSLILDQGASEIVVSYGYDQYTDTWITNPTEMTDGYGYWLYAKDYDVMIVEGTDKLGPPSPPATYEFTAGWVLAGYKSTTSMEIGEYIESLELGSYFSTVYIWDAETPAWDTINTVADELFPGQGFWIWMYSDQNLIPPMEVVP